MSESAAQRVFHPKVTGSWRLHTTTAHLDLDWWVTFSSAASLLGSPGQGAYAAANSWVDGLVAYRRSLGLPAVGHQLGPMGGGGARPVLRRSRRLDDHAEQGLAAMQLVLAADRSATGVFGLDARQWFQSFPAAAQSSLFSELAEASTIERRGGGRIQAELAAMPGSRTPRSRRVNDRRRDPRGASLERSDRPPSGDESLGLDSLMALELRNRLESSLGITLPAALVWAYPTISDLAGALCERWASSRRPKPQKPPMRNRRWRTRKCNYCRIWSRPVKRRSRREPASHDEPSRPRGPTVAKGAGTSDA